MDLEENQEVIQTLIEAIGETKNRLGQVLDRQNCQECCYLIGITGAGKSSLTSYLCGANITYKENGMGQYDLKHDNMKLPVIGNTQKSQTTIPGLFKTQDGMPIYDPPGFNATTGKTQEILDSYCTAKMFKVGCYAKIIIVLQQSSLKSSRGRAVADVAVRLANLFGRRSIEIINSCLLIVSKTDGCDEYYQEIVTQKVRSISSCRQILGVQAQTLLSRLVFENRIICFPKPQLLQKNPSIIKKIHQKIRQLPNYGITRELQVTLSSEAQNMMDSLSESILGKQQKLCKAVGDELTQKIKQRMSTKDELLQAKKIITSGLRMLQEKILDKGIQQQKKEFYERLLISQTNIDKFNKIDSQLEFCKTLSPQITINSIGTSTLKVTMSRLLNQIDGELQKIMTKEEIEKNNEANRQFIEKQSREHREQMNRIQRQNNDRIDRLRQQAAEQNRIHNEQMAENQDKFMNQMMSMQRESQRLRREDLAKQADIQKAQLELLSQNLTQVQKQQQQDHKASQGRADRILQIMMDREKKRENKRRRRRR